ncbi:MAG TPA: hypothetical protein DDY70_06675 [Clostridiales bacterium]|nr:hypothetical protein [Clostridiales bacterium]
MIFTARRGFLSSENVEKNQGVSALLPLFCQVQNLYTYNFQKQNGSFKIKGEYFGADIVYYMQ